MTIRCQGRYNVDIEKIQEAMTTHHHIVQSGHRNRSPEDIIQEFILLSHCHNHHRTPQPFAKSKPIRAVQEQQMRRKDHKGTTKSYDDKMEQFAVV